MDYASYSQQIASLADRYRRADPNDEVQILCKVARLVRMRTESLVERMGPFLGYSPASVVSDDAGLVDSSSRLRMLLNSGWGTGHSDFLSANQGAVLERSLADVAICLSTVHPGAAITALAEVVLATRRRDWAALLGRRTARSELQSEVSMGRVDAHWLTPAESARAEPHSESGAHAEFASWLSQRGVQPIVPPHLRGELQPVGGPSDYRTAGCDVDSEVTYSAFAMDSAIRAPEDFFISASRSNGYANYWGFACRSANVVVAVHLGGNAIEGEDSIFNSRALRLYQSVACRALERPSVGKQLDAVLVLSNFRPSALTLDPGRPPARPDGAQEYPLPVDDPRSSVQTLAALHSAMQSASRSA